MPGGCSGCGSMGCGCMWGGRRRSARRKRRLRDRCCRGAGLWRNRLESIEVRKKAALLSCKIFGGRHFVDQTFSLYLDLESGQIADLETVARVSLALSQAVKDIAKTIDP